MPDVKGTLTRPLRALGLNRALERLPWGRALLRGYRRWLGPERYAGELPPALRIAGTDVVLRPDDVFTAHFCYRARGGIEDGELLYEPAMTRAVRSSLPGAGAAIDAGAHVGYFTLMMAALAPDLLVHAFEPLERFADVIEKHARRNGLDNVEVVRRPLGRGGETVDFGNYLDHARTRATGLDEYCAGRGCQPRFVKMDVEGQELDILEGGRATLASSGPTLAVEVHPAKIAARGRHHAEVLDLLDEAGYSLRLVRRRPEGEASEGPVGADRIREAVGDGGSTYVLVAEPPC